MKVVISGTKNWSSTKTHTHTRTKPHMEAGTLPKKGGDLIDEEDVILRTIPGPAYTPLVALVGSTKESILLFLMLDMAHCIATACLNISILSTL